MTKPPSPFAGIDRTAAPESLQHVAAPVDIEQAVCQGIRRIQDTDDRLWPTTSADLLELDAVPDPIDSAAPARTYLPGCAPVGPDAETRPYRRRRRTVTGPDGVPGPVVDDGTRWDQEP